MSYLIAYVAMIVGAICTLIALTAMRRREKHNIGKMGWLFLILLTPPIGLILFLLLGGKKVSAEHEERSIVDLPIGHGNTDDEQLAEGNIAVKRGLPSPNTNNQLWFLATPQAMHSALFDLIDSANERLLVHSFIMANDQVGNDVVDRLCDKAKSGVEVRFMVDGFGSFFFPNSLLQRLRKAGGKAAKFKPLSKWSRFAYSNFRNHRKMIVADGNHAVVGGANFVEYEMTAEPNEETWIDYCLSISGDAARQIETIFLSDWNFVTNEGLAGSDGDRICVGNSAADRATLQVIPVGADGPAEILDDVWLTAINRATKRIRICTPYFVPPPMAVRSLAMAARRGVEVQILYPDRSDLALADYARYDYAHDLQEMGAEIVRIPNKMVHAKLLIIDDIIAFGGSANFDMRSFFLNYELVIGIFNRPKVDELSRWFDEQVARSIDRAKNETPIRKSLSVLTRIIGEEL